ncbi:MAG: DUF3299 domain-containing protein [Opitutaceae bacterium]
MKSPLYLLTSIGLTFAFAAVFPAGAADVMPAAANVAPPSAPVAPPAVEKGYLKLSFDHLASFSFVVPTGDEGAAAKSADQQIPTNVKSWNGKKAQLVGFMIPVKMEKGLVTEFLLMRNTLACCYGATPSVNEWVTVKMKKGIPPTMDVPVEFYGELKVKAVFENGYLSGIYQLEGERMGDVKG